MGCKSLACATVFNLLINLALQLTFGGMCMLPQHRGGMSFCRQTVVQYCTFRYKVIALAKTMTP